MGNQQRFGSDRGQFKDMPANRDCSSDTKAKPRKTYQDRR